MQPKPRILGRLLVDDAGLPEAELEAALEAQRASGRRLGEVLVERGALDEEAVARALATQLSLPYLEPPLQPEPEAVALVRSALARSRRVLPLDLRTGGLRLAMADPLDLSAVDDVRFQSGRRVSPGVATPGSVARGLERAYGPDASRAAGAPSGASPGAAAGEDEADSVEVLPTPEVLAGTPPVVRWVDDLLATAVERRASDVHLEPSAEVLATRYRIDGVLRRIDSRPPVEPPAVISRLKIMAGMDIAVKRRPQDGGFTLSHDGRDLSVRVSTLPVTGGEKAVLRLLDAGKAPADLGVLGFSDRDLRRLRAVLAGGQGVVLAAGPTGSGKSTTLVAALGEVDHETRNVVTLEDPVEYRLPGIGQVEVKPRSGLTFPAALRAVLRQDPDVIMVGEIRDRETAEIAMAAAVTGHLVLSTVHTIDAPSALTRLLNMGVPPFLVAGGLAGVVAQRLVRRVCGRCRGRRGKACSECPDGFLGRTGVYQVLVLNDRLRDEVVRGGGTGTYRRLATAAGMGAMADDARRKVAEGVTTPHEVARVLQTDPGAALPCDGCGSEVPLGSEGCPGCGRLQVHRCTCGRPLEPGWRYCPSCLRRARGVPTGP